MPDSVVHVLEAVTHGLEIAGAGVLLLGFAVATLRAIVQASREGDRPAYRAYRQALGRVVLIGLEVLVAATILKTVTVAPTPADLGRLAAMIGIRTILGWTMVLEMNGRWPWQAKPVESETA
jgi:uncharacterized membrane protein